MECMSSSIPRKSPIDNLSSRLSSGRALNTIFSVYTRKFITSFLKLHSWINGFI